MHTSNDFWTHRDTYENTIKDALLACATMEVETPQLKGLNALNVQRIGIIRREGIYIPGHDTTIPTITHDGEWVFDRVRQPLPIKGCVGLNVVYNHLPADGYGGFFRVVYLRERMAISPGWQRGGPGQLYEMFFMATQDHTAEGERLFFSVSDQGKITAGKRHSSTPGMSTERIEAIAAVALQYITDRRFAWSIEVKHHRTVLTLGCTETHVGSLFRAHDLPVKLTPIFHLIHVHRLGVRDQDASRYVNKKQLISIKDVTFTVKPAQNIHSV